MAIVSQIPAVRTRLLLGSDNVDRWSRQSTWDAVLSGLHVVVSTHAILSDALSHGFVRMRKLALIIFDEGKIPFVRCYPSLTVFQLITARETTRPIES